MSGKSDIKISSAGGRRAESVSREGDWSFIVIKEYLVSWNGFQNDKEMDDEI
tara:strand:- start:755 stop:910 length:156 start_codon:yes stop_codon:yes gene_type:complete